MKRRLSISLISNLLLIFTLIISSYALLNSQTGLRSTFWIVEKFIPGKLSVNQLEGRLTGPITVTELNYQNNDIEFTVDKLQIDWKLKHLIQKQLAIKNLIINQAKIKIKPSNIENNFDWHSFINHIKLSNAKINQLFIQYGNSTLKISGQLEKQWQLNWLFDIANLKDFGAELQGRLTLQGGITGNRNTPQLFVKLNQDNFIYNNWQLKKIIGLLTVNVSSSMAWQLKLTAPKLQNKKTIIQPVILTAQGTLQPFNLNIQLAPITFETTNEDEETIKLKLPTSQLQTFLTQQGLHSEFKFTPQKYFNFIASLNLPNYFAKSLPSTKQIIQAKVHFLLHNLGYLDLLLPKFKNMRGLLGADAIIIGTIANPKPSGEIFLQNARGQIPILGLSLHDIKIKSTFSTETIKWLGSLKSGNGFLSVTGTTALKQKKLPTALDLQGQNFTASNNKSYKIIASPHLKIKIDATRINVTGNIFIPQAHIHLGGSEEDTVVDLSSDVAFIDKKKSTGLAALPIYSNINLSFGNQVKLQYEGLHTSINGNINLTDEPNRPTSASGQINLIKGHYKYYSETLNIKDGSHILFAGGPVDNPILNISVAKKVTAIPQTSNLPNNITSNNSSSFFASLAEPLQSVTITVGIHVQGHAQNPQLKLFSDPAILNQTDILSYLVTGQPSNQLGAASAQILFNAASNLGNKGSDLKSLIKSIQQGIGLDQLGIQSTSYLDTKTNTFTPNTSLVLGKTLSPRLYINYSIGLLEPVNVFQVNYLLTKYFSLQSANSTLANSIDLLFKIEN